MRLREIIARADGALVPVGELPADPPVLAVATTDLLDPRRYLAGGELVLTGLAWWRPDQPDRSHGFVAALVGAGVAALAAGEAEFGAIPEDLIGACAAAGLPLLRVPLAFSFATITERVSRQIAGGEGVIGMLSRQRVLVEAVAAAARDRGPAVLNEVLALVERDLGVRGWVLSATGRLLAGPATGVDDRDRRRLAERHLNAGTGGRPTRFATVTVPPDVPRAVAWLLVVEPADPDGVVDPAVVGELTSLVALERELALRRPDADDALAAALGGSSAADVAVALRRCGLAEGPAVVVAARGDWAAAVISEALADGPDLWVLGRTGALGRAAEQTLAVVASADAGSVVDRLAATIALLAPGLGSAPVQIGVSDAVGEASAVLAAVAEARALVATAAPSPAVAGPDRLASSALLLAAVPAELRAGYVDRVLGPLLDHDRVHRTDLVGTLRNYLDCSGSWSRCAERMHLHVNTLRYRVERIQALTGRDLRRLDDQIDLLFAVRLLDAP